MERAAGHRIFARLEHLAHLDANSRRLQGAPNKGTALERELDRLDQESALYLRDDETDEDVFVLEKPGRLLGVRVGDDRPTRASFHLTDQLGIDRVLQLLIGLRSDGARQQMG